MQQKKQVVTVLGSTGSIGVNTLDVIARQSGAYEVFALTANTQVDLLAAQCRQWRPQFAVMVSEIHGRRLQQQLREDGLSTQVLWGSAALDTVAADPQVTTVMAAIVGAAGLSSCIAAALAGKRLPWTWLTMTANCGLHWRHWAASKSTWVLAVSANTS